MIRCTPQGLCSWNFFLDGENHHASVEFNWIGEQGALIADGIAFEVHKHGLFRGHWTLDRNQEIVASAQKANPFTRTFEIQHGQYCLILQAESPFGRSFCVQRSEEVIATICPVHAFTRRATIETFAPRWDFPTICFAFWLVVLTWRRAAANSSSSGASAAGT
jgi:hypothetical protein